MPHACGDEPKIAEAQGMSAEVCPTYVGMNRSTKSPDGKVKAYAPPHVGMNRMACRGSGFRLRMPHVCGDEPADRGSTARRREYAPRMWG